MKKSVLLLLLFTFTFHGCSKKRQSIDPNTNLPEIIFQEIHPENEGRISSEGIEWDKWTWHEDFEPGDTLAQGTHFSLSGEALPAGLTFEIEITGKRSGILRLKGQAENHHVSDSMRGLILDFQKEAFLNASPNALKSEQVTWSVGIQFGKGYTISGTVDNADGKIVLREMKLDQTSEIEITDGKFELEKLYEEDDLYVIQIEEHPEGQCCKFIEAEGKMGSANIDNLYLSCHTPQWHHPVNSSDTFFPAYHDEAIASVEYSFYDNLHASNTNSYGDYILGYYSQMNDSNSSGIFASIFNENTQTWSHPLTNSVYDDFQFYLPDPNNLIPFGKSIKSLNISDDKSLEVIHNQTTGSINFSYQNFSHTFEDGTWSRPDDLSNVMLNTGLGQDDELVEFKKLNAKNKIAVSYKNLAKEIYYHYFDGSEWRSPVKINFDLTSSMSSTSFSNVKIHISQNGNGSIFYTHEYQDRTKLYAVDVQNFQVIGMPSNHDDTILNTSAVLGGSDAFKAIQLYNEDIVVAFRGHPVNAGNLVDSDFRMYITEKMNGTWDTNPQYINQINGEYENGFNFQIVSNSKDDVFIVWDESHPDYWWLELYSKKKVNGVWFPRETIQELTRQELPGNDNHLGAVFESGKWHISLDHSGKPIVGYATIDFLLNSNEREFKIKYASYDNDWNVEAVASNYTSDLNNIYEVLFVSQDIHNLEFIYKNDNGNFFQRSKNINENSWGLEQNPLSSVTNDLSNPVIEYRGATKPSSCGVKNIFWKVRADGFNSRMFISQFK